MMHAAATTAVSLVVREDGLLLLGRLGRGRLVARPVVTEALAEVVVRDVVRSVVVPIVVLIELDRTDHVHARRHLLAVLTVYQTRSTN